MHEALKTKQYVPKPYQAFFVKDPKLRHIHKADVRDRVVHQALFRILYPIVDAQLSSSVYSARKCHGTHKGIGKLFQALRKETRNWKREAWVLKCDVRKFFDSIDHAILREKIKEYGFDADTQRLIDTILSSFEKTVGKGLPLGNVTSQLFANVYLNEFDWFVKRELRIKHYFRYCDDFVIVLERHSHARTLLPILKSKLATSALLLHPNKIAVRKVRQGIDFLGYVILPGVVVLRTSTKKRIYRNAARHHDNRAVIDSYLGVSTYARNREVTKQLLSYKSLL